MKYPAPPARPRSLRTGLLSLCVALGACASATFEDPPDRKRPDGESRPGTPGQPDPGAPGTPGDPGTSPAPGGPAAMVPVPTEPSLLPARVRRLSNFEYDRTIGALFQTSTSFAKALAVDFRQSDFTANASQQVDSTYATQLQEAARTLATESVPRLIAAAGCQAAQGEACAQTFIAGFGQQAYRRPLTDAEKAGLLAVFRAVVRDGGTFQEGIELVVQAMLQSPHFLYLTELGDGRGTSGVVRLTDWEIAAQLSYTLTGGPPDKALLDAAAGRKLGTAAERATQAKRLLGTSAARAQVQRLVKEWLMLDRLESTAKDARVYPRYDDLRPRMAKESDDFIAEVVFNDDGSLGKLLTADYTVVDQTLGQFYGIGGAQAGRRAVMAGGPRRGLLMQGAFLSVHAHDNESAPIKRGNVILEKLLCVTIPDPGELNLMITPPKPDPTKTTREKFAAHAQDPACAGCHRRLDPFGFALEAFDGMGGHRTTDNGKPVDTRATLTAADLEAVAVANGAEMAASLGGSAEVQRCFARNMFRFAAAQTGQGYEDQFLQTVWDAMPAGEKVDVKALLVALASGEGFVQRRLP